MCITKNLLCSLLMVFILINGYAQSKLDLLKDSTEFYKTQSEIVNGCTKIISWKAYDAKTKIIKKEWWRDFAKDKNQTCDFSAYVIYKKQYRKGKLFASQQYFAGSEEAEEKPCGLWKFYNSEGKVYKSIKYGKCNIDQFSKR